MTLLVAVGAAHALELITLRNGFTLQCARHDVIGDRVRLYSSPGEPGYQELTAAQISGIEVLPDPPASTSVQHDNATLTVTSKASLQQLLAHAGTEHNIDIELLASVIRAESAFNPKAISRAGARGLMQLMPGTARELGVKDASQADQNIAGGTAYLDSLLRLYRDNLALALAAYNAGPGAVARYHGVPPFRETRAYVARVINEFNRRKRAPGATMASR